MSDSMLSANALFFGDNLEILRREIASDTIDLIYLDPPFNSKATYNVLFAEKSGEQSAAQITAFEDTWHWGTESESIFRELVSQGQSSLSELMQALRSFLGSNDMMAYLTMMAPRLVELHRVLSPTGSIYLHCDPTASHYLKLVMDAVFGAEYFQNEIIWYYKGAGISPRRWGRRHDTIFWYSKSHEYFFDPDPVREEYAESTKQRFAHQIGNVRGNRDYGQQSLNPKGKHPDDVWQIPILAPSAAERLSYPTQKPETLLERIVLSSSKEGDLILDPFCGCGTTVSVAERLHRRWMGIDITHLAITLIKHRLRNTFESSLSDYAINGLPKDLSSAKALAKQDRFHFEWWALGLVDARPAHDKKKGADSGVDGYIFFFDNNGGVKKIVVQVKSGKVSVSQIRDLKGVLAREKATIGVFITLERPTKPMKKEAAATGIYVPDHFPEMKVPRLQILTIKDLLSGAEAQYPRVAPAATFKRAKPKQKQKKPDKKLF